MLHRPGTALAAVLITLAFTSTASATSYCVAPASGCDVAATSLNDALTQAATHTGDDSISLGAATYQENLAAYAPGDNAAVTITGAGSGSTVIRPLTSSDSSMTLQGTSGPINLVDLAVLTGTHTGNTAIELDGGGSLGRVRVLSDTGATSPNGVESQATTSISASQIDVIGNGDCVRGGSSTPTLNVFDSTLADCSAGIATNAARTYAQRLRITNVVGGINVIGSTSAVANLDDSIVTMRTSAGNAASVSQFGSANGTLYLNQDTFIGVGSGTAVSSYNHASSGAANVHVYDTIMRGFATSMTVDSAGSGNPAYLFADYDDYDGTLSGAVTHSNDQTADPQFVDAANGDYHLRASSPLIDLDATPIDTFGGESTTDLDGSVRIINSKRDIGAYERPLLPAAATGDAAGVTTTSATIPATANGGGAFTTVKLVYGTTGAYGSEKPLALTTADFADTHYSVALADLTPSTTYHYALVATNSAGTATSADRTFTTGASPVTQPPPPTPPVAKAALSALKLSPARFRAAGKGATFARIHTGTKVTFRLSAAGTVTFRVLRATSGVMVGARCVAKSSSHPVGRACTRYVAVGKAIRRSAKAGTNTLRFSGRVGGKKLRPGSYRLQSRDPAGTTRSVRFTIVR